MTTFAAYLDAIMKPEPNGSSCGALPLGFLTSWDFAASEGLADKAVDRISWRS